MAARKPGLVLSPPSRANRALHNATDQSLIASCGKMKEGLSLGLCVNNKRRQTDSQRVTMCVGEGEREREKE